MPLQAKAKANEPQAKAVPPVEGEEEMSPEAKAASIVLEQLQESMGGPDGFVPANPSLAAIHTTERHARRLWLPKLPRTLPLLLLAGPGGVLAGFALRGTTGGLAV